MDSERAEHSRPNGGRTAAVVNLFPTLITLGNLICGFAAVGVTAHAQFLWKPEEPRESLGAFALAGGLVLLAMVFDGLDGKVARLTRLTSEFGAQLDSLADLVSFGVAPASIVFLEAASRNVFNHYWPAFVCSGLYVVCAALRLARFNVETEPGREPLRYFRGVPTPAAAGVVAALAIFEWRMKQELWWSARIMPYAAVVLGALMISRFPYSHLLRMLFAERRPFTHLVVFVFTVFTVLAIPLHFEYVLLAGFGVYVLSGPVVFLWDLSRRRRPPVDAPNEDASIF